MPRSFNERSLRALKEPFPVHPDLVKVCMRAIEISDLDFTITCGGRTQAQQNELYAQGRTKPGPKVTWTLKSNHMKQKDGYAHAIDVVADLDDGPGLKISWNGPDYDIIAKAFLRAADELKIPIVWGGTFPNVDKPHFELDGSVYRRD